MDCRRPAWRCGPRWSPRAFRPRRRRALATPRGSGTRAEGSPHRRGRPPQEGEEPGPDLRAPVRTLVPTVLGQAEQEAQLGGDPLRVGRIATAVHHVLEPVGDLGRPRLARHTESAPDQVDQWGEGDVLPELAGPADQNLGLPGEAGQNLLNQATLPDP